MTKFEKSELWRELNATDESYVREKFALGNYPLRQRKLVSEWIATRDRERDQLHLAGQRKATNRLIFWGLVTAVATSIGVIFEAAK